jgi:hypothetical protein
MVKAGLDVLMAHLPKIVDGLSAEWFIKPNGYELVKVMIEEALAEAPDWPPEVPQLRPVAIPPEADRLAGIASLVRALTYGEMMTMVSEWYGRDKSDPAAPIGYGDMPGTLHEWATKPESTDG